MTSTIERASGNTAVGNTAVGNTAAGRTSANGATQTGGRATSAGSAHDQVGFTHLSAYNGRPSSKQILGLLALTVLIAGVFGQLAYFLEGLRPDVWQARTQIEYRGNSWTETQGVTIQSNTLQAPIAARHDISMKDFEKRLEATLRDGTQTIQIDYFDNDADLALAIVTELSNAYLAEVTERSSPEALEILNQELGLLQVELADARLELSRLERPEGQGLSLEQQDKQSEIATIRTRIGEFEKSILDAELNELNNTRVPRIVAEPFVFEEPYVPRQRRMAIVGAVLGTLVGLGILVWKWWIAAVKEAF